MRSAYMLTIDLGDETSYSLAYVYGDGTIEVHNGDPGLVTTWEWRSDRGCYLEIGGTGYIREYYPGY